MPTSWTPELEHEILLALLAYYSGSRPPNWGLMSHAINEELLTRDGGRYDITASALRQHVTKKMMKRETYSKLKEFFEMNNGGDGNGKPDGGAAGAGAGGTTI